MRPARFYAGIITAIILMLVTLAVLASIPVTKPAPPQQVRGPLTITESAVDVTAPQPHKAKRTMRGPHSVSRQQRGRHSSPPPAPRRMLTECRTQN
ncbi:MAG TPA: hypothetical protein VII12_14370 [Thermoanaerobaculia bacterium]|jgi:hypothetical protein